MIYIFLDMDGVLNSSKSFSENKKNKKPMRDWNYHFSYECINEFKNFLSYLNKYEIIISSSWRTLKEPMEWVKKMFEIEGIPMYKDVTNHNMKKRGEQIEDYCAEHFISKEDVIILDDDSDMENFMDRLVKTEFATGFTRETTVAALSLITKKGGNTYGK